MSDNIGAGRRQKIRKEIKFRFTIFFFCEMCYLSSKGCNIKEAKYSKDRRVQFELKKKNSSG